MANPFKFFGVFALLLIVVAVAFGWFVTATPARDELGPIPVREPGIPLSQSMPPEQEPPGPKVPLNTPAPALDLPGVTGGGFSLARFRGKSPVIVYFFATWCPHCATETPLLIRLYEQHRRQGLAAVAITQEKPEAARPFLKKNPFPFPVVYDQGGKIGAAFGAQGVPVTCVVDREGKLVANLSGFMEEAFQRDIAGSVQRLVAP